MHAKLKHGIKTYSYSLVYLVEKCALQHLDLNTNKKDQPYVMSQRGTISLSGEWHHSQPLVAVVALFNL